MSMNSYSSMDRGRDGAEKAAPETNGSTRNNRVQAIARGAGVAAAGARDAMTQLLAAPMPDVNLYTEPLNPTLALTANDRLQLVLESCRPWSEFADIKALNLPLASEVKLRLGHNFEIFFYNYLVVGLSILAVTALFHPLRAIGIAALVVVAVLIYIIFPEDYRITESFSVSRPAKHVVMVIAIILLLTIGHVFSMLIFFMSIFLPLSLIHAFLREHSASSVSNI